jgi:serine protease AprX
MAFVDSGFYPHPDIRDRVLAHIDATFDHIVEGRRFHKPMIYSWHGQMTSVIAAGDGRTSNGRYRGIACNAQLVLIKVSTRRMRIKEPDILRGLRWIADHHAHFGIRVVNVSVGGDYPSADPDHPLHVVIRELTDQGITVLIAAGNTGMPVLVPPASAAEAITIGGINDQNSLDQRLWLPYLNSYGLAYNGTPKPDVTAHAAWIASPILPGSTMHREARWLAPLLDLEVGDTAGLREILRQGSKDLDLISGSGLLGNHRILKKLQDRIREHKLIDAHHQFVDGTSVSVAIASSIVAQMLEAQPGLTPARIKAILTETAVALPGVPTEMQGAGRIDAARAVQIALNG